MEYGGNIIVVAALIAVCFAGQVGSEIRTRIIKMYLRQNPPSAPLFTLSPIVEEGLEVKTTEFAENFLGVEPINGEIIEVRENFVSVKTEDSEVTVPLIYLEPVKFTG